MTSDAASPARAAAERTAQAVLAGNLAQLMADITPEALAQMMQLSTQAQAQGGGGFSIANMPSMTGYEIEDGPAAGSGDEVFHLTFHSSAGDATLATTWREIMGQWKIASIALVSATRASDA